jgi:hypothetical protein
MFQRITDPAALPEVARYLALQIAGFGAALGGGLS